MGNLNYVKLFSIDKIKTSLSNTPYYALSAAHEGSSKFVELLTVTCNVQLLNFIGMLQTLAVEMLKKIQVEYRGWSVFQSVCWDSVWEQLWDGALRWNHY